MGLWVSPSFLIDIPYFRSMKFTHQADWSQESEYKSVKKLLSFLLCLITLAPLSIVCMCVCLLQARCPAACQPAACSLKRPALWVNGVPLGRTAPGFRAADPGNKTTHPCQLHIHITNLPPTQRNTSGPSLQNNLPWCRCPVTVGQETPQLLY